MRRLMAVLLALLATGCTSSSLNTLEDIREGFQALTGNPVTPRIRLERIHGAHGHADASSWPLLLTEDGESQLRSVLREIEKLESTDFETLTPRMATVLHLGDIGTRSQSALVRARASLAVARLGTPLSLDEVSGPRSVDDAMVARILDLRRQADAAVPPVGGEDRDTLKASRREALMALVELRFWPPGSFERSRDGHADAFRVGREWSRFLLDFAGLERFRPDRADPGFGPGHEALAEGLAAEVIRYTVANALLRDSDAQVRFDAVGAVIEIGTRDLVPVLASAARMESADLVRFRLALALGELGGANRREAVPALLTLLSDFDPNVRHAAHESLRTVTGADVGEDPAAWKTWWAANRPTEDRSGSGRHG